MGAGLGFLWFNTYPAQVFMGDVGALAIGAALGTVAVIVRQEIVLAIMGGIFVIETLSVILQVISFKITGRRLFRMAPLHHHFELKGWEEPKNHRSFLDYQPDSGPDRTGDAEDQVATAAMNRAANTVSTDKNPGRAVVVGLGVTGLSCIRYLDSLGVSLTVMDTRAEPPYLETLSRFYPHIDLHAGSLDTAVAKDTDLLVMSPGVALTEPAVLEAINAGVEVVGDIELFARDSYGTGDCRNGVKREKHSYDTDRPHG